jgi:hypothetical protein
MDYISTVFLSSTPKQQSKCYLNFIIIGKVTGSPEINLVYNMSRLLTKMSVALLNLSCSIFTGLSLEMS